MPKCESCKRPNHDLSAAVVNGTYYRKICRNCLGKTDDGISGSAASFDRRRQYEDHAQDTVQPYDANGPNAEFLRLYPDAAKKVFSPDVIDKLKHKI